MTPEDQRIAARLASRKTYQVTGADSLSAITKFIGPIGPPGPQGPTGANGTQGTSGSDLFIDYVNILLDQGFDLPDDVVALIE